MGDWKRAMIGKYAHMHLVNKDRLIEKLIAKGYLMEFRNSEGDILYRTAKEIVVEEVIADIFVTEIIDPIEIIEEYEKNGNIENCYKPETKDNEKSQDMPYKVT